MTQFFEKHSSWCNQIVDWYRSNKMSSQSSQNQIPRTQTPSKRYNEHSQCLIFLDNSVKVSTKLFAQKSDTSRSFHRKKVKIFIIAQPLHMTLIVFHSPLTESTMSRLFSLYFHNCSNITPSPETKYGSMWNTDIVISSILPSLSRRNTECST